MKTRTVVFAVLAALGIAGCCGGKTGGGGGAAGFYLTGGVFGEPSGPQCEDLEIAAGAPWSGFVGLLPDGVGVTECEPGYGCFTDFTGVLLQSVPTDVGLVGRFLVETYAKDTCAEVLAAAPADLEYQFFRADDDEADPEFNLACTGTNFAGSVAEGTVTVDLDCEAEIGSGGGCEFTVQDLAVTVNFDLLAAIQAACVDVSA